MDQVGFIGKVILLSAVLAVLVKYGGSLLPLAPTPSTALVTVFFPSLTMAIALWWRSR
ncbi:MAG: hypothetical protein ACFB4I_09620 [Cyanophyceae cyanobacterium]